MPLSGIKPGSNSAVVRNNLADIEAALAAGVSRENVYEALKAEHGLAFKYNAFCVALKRARAKRPKAPATPGTGVQSKRNVLRNTKIELRNTYDVDCAIQLGSTETEAPLPGLAPKDRIIKPSDFSEVHEMDFSDLDPKYRKKR